MESIQEHKVPQIKELSGRFYAIAVFIITTSCALLYYVYTGDTTNEGTIPFTNIVVKNIVVLKYILFGVIIAGLVVLDFEWLRYRKGPKNISDTLQYIFCLLCSIIVLLITYQNVVQHMSFQSISRWQWLTMVLLGAISGRVCSSIRNGFRFIRPKEYASKVHSLHIPIISRVFWTIDGIAFLLIMGTIVWINSMWGQQATIYLYLAFFTTTIYFFTRCQLTLKPDNIERQRKLIDKIDNLAYEMYAAPFLLPAKLNDDETNMQQARRITRDKFRTLHVCSNETLDIAMLRHIDQTQINDFICVEISCMGQKDKQKIPVVFIYEAFLQLQNEKMDDDELLQESIFWATIFVVVVDQYKHVPQTRPEAIVNFVFAGFPFAVSRLLKLKKCNLNELLPRGWTPLLAAAAQGEAEIAKTLLFYGADPDKANLKGITPLMYTARYNHNKTCKTILDHSPNLNIQDEYGSTAIIVAIKNNSIEVFDSLLESGADLSIKDSSGKTALDWAYQNGLGEFARKIKNKLNN